jgi:hypothetical protein
VNLRWETRDRGQSVIDAGNREALSDQRAERHTAPAARAPRASVDIDNQWGIPRIGKTEVQLELAVANLSKFDPGQRSFAR